MSSVRPLVFLYVRTILNGIRRALSSPKRLIGVLFFLGYYWFIAIRPFSNLGSSRRSRSRDILPNLPFALPDIATIDAVVFGGFALLTLFLSLGIFSYRATFRASDIDVLFPTPIPPRLVLVFRFVRDSLITLVSPLFFAVFLYQPASAPVGALFRNHPEFSGAMLRSGTIAWTLLVLAWTSVGYAISLLTARDDDRALRAAKIVKWSLPFFILGPPAIFAAQFYFNPTVAGAVSAAHNPFLRGILFFATSAAAMTVPGAGGPLSLTALAGFAVLLATTIGAFTLAIRQAPWLYDSAASRGGDEKSTVRELARRNDYTGLRTLAAQKGKYKNARLATRYARRTVSGAKAILWREVVVTLRSGLVANLIGFVATTIFPPFFLLIPDKRGFTTVLYLVMSAFMLSIMAMAGSNQNFIETLRKVDTTKPLPFAPQKIVGYEVLSKSLLAMGFSVMPFVIGFVIRPSAWDYHLTGILIGPALVFAVSAVMFLVAILFPDFEDPTQRGFRGMVMLLATACTIIPIFVFPGLALIGHYSPLIGVPFSLLVAAGVTFLALLWSGRLYSDYNPSE